eukprot:UN03063
MSGIESLVTQVHRGETAPRTQNGQVPQGIPQQQQQQSQPSQQQQQPQQQQQQQQEPQQQQQQDAPSVWSRIFCCGSKPKNAQDSPQTRPLVQPSDNKSSSSSQLTTDEPTPIQNNNIQQQQQNQQQQQQQQQQQRVNQTATATPVVNNTNNNIAHQPAPLNVDLDDETRGGQQSPRIDRAIAPPADEPAPLQQQQIIPLQQPNQPDAPPTFDKHPTSFNPPSQ